MQRRGSEDVETEEEKKRVNLSDVRASLCHSASSSFKCHLKKTSLTSHCVARIISSLEKIRTTTFSGLHLFTFHLHLSAERRRSQGK